MANKVQGEEIYIREEAKRESEEIIQLCECITPNALAHDLWCHVVNRLLLSFSS